MSYRSYASLAFDFQLSASYLQKIIESMITGLTKRFKQEFINFIPKETQNEINLKNELFPNVGLILDFSVQDILDLLMMLKYYIRTNTKSIT